MLFSIHLAAAAILKAPDWALSEDESGRLAAAVVRVSELYDLPLLDEKTRAWLNLGVAGCGVYGPRIAAAAIDRSRKLKEQRERQQQEQSGPVDIYTGRAVVQ